MLSRNNNGSCEGIFWEELFPPKMPPRPIIKGACPHANACLTCGDFRTTLEFIDQHKEQLEQTEKIIEKALVNNWQRQVEMNTQVQTNLKNIISSLESQ